MPNQSERNLVNEELLKLLLCLKVNFNTVVKYIVFYIYIVQENITS